MYSEDMKSEVVKIFLQCLVLTGCMVMVNLTWLIVSIMVVSDMDMWPPQISEQMYNLLRIPINIIVWLGVFWLVCELAYRVMRRIGLIYDQARVSMFFMAGALAVFLFIPTMLLYLGLFFFSLARSF